MTALNRENLEIKFEENVAFLTLSGAVAQDDMDEGLGWFDALCASEDSFTICVEMAKNDFEDLGEVSKEFRRVARVMRRAVNAKKCAVLTDSLFLRNSAKVEGAVVPGLDLQTFAIKSKDNAVRWLRGESLLDDAPQITAPAATLAPQAPQAGLTKKTPSNDSEKDSVNPWDNLDLKKVDL